MEEMKIKKDFPFTPFSKCNNQFNTNATISNYTIYLDRSLGFISIV